MNFDFIQSSSLASRKRTFTEIFSWIIDLVWTWLVVVASTLTATARGRLEVVASGWVQWLTLVSSDGRQSGDERCVVLEARWGSPNKRFWNSISFSINMFLKVLQRFCFIWRICVYILVMRLFSINTQMLFLVGWYVIMGKMREGTGWMLFQDACNYGQFRWTFRIHV